MARFFELLEARELLSVSPVVKAPPETIAADQLAITTAIAQLATDKVAWAATLKTDRAAIPSVNATNKANIKASEQAVKDARGNPTYTASRVKSASSSSRLEPCSSAQPTWPRSRSSTPPCAASAAMTTRLRSRRLRQSSTHAPAAALIASTPNRSPILSRNHARTSSRAIPNWLAYASSPRSKRGSMLLSFIKYVIRR